MLLGQEVTVRKFQEDDYPAFAILRMAVDPGEVVTPDEVRWQDTFRDDWCVFNRFVATVQGEMVGFAEFGNEVYSFNEKEFLMDLWVHPNFKNNGVGKTLYEFFENSMTQYAVDEVRTRVRSDRPEAITFARNRGFVENDSFWEMYLNISQDLVERMDESFRKQNKSMSQSGIRIFDLNEIEQQFANYEEKLYKLEALSSLDIPQPTPHTFPSFATWKKGTLTGPRLRKEVYLVAVHDEEFVGVEVMFGSSLDRELLLAGLQSVHPDWRRKGIARALSNANLLRAYQEGYSKILDWTGSDNSKMLALQEELGFKKLPLWHGMVKSMRDRSGE